MKKQLKEFAMLVGLLWALSIVFCLMLMSIDFIHNFELNYLPIIRLVLALMLNASVVYVFAIMFIEKSKQ